MSADIRVREEVIDGAGQAGIVLQMERGPRTRALVWWYGDLRKEWCPASWLRRQSRAGDAGDPRSDWPEW